MDFYYVNNRGERIDLSDYPYIFQEGNLLDWVYSYNTDSLATRDVTYGYKMAAKTIPVKVAVLCDYTIPLEERKEQWKEAVDHLADVVQADVIDGKDGRLYTDTGFYLSCKIIGSEKTDWRMGLPIMFNALTVLVDKPVWIREETKEFFSQSEVPAPEDGFLDYEYDYEYDYTAQKIGISDWYIDHYQANEFKMTIFGPCVNPRILINGYPYEVFDTLEAGEYIVVDSRENSVTKHLVNGTVQNVYDLRAKDQSIFEPIPSGYLNISWSGAFGFEVTLYIERGEPRWKTKSS